jgi:LmbE family N-acetylglucosaminyl deacetylase
LVADRTSLASELEDLAGGRGTLLLIAAHPDDEVIGAGALLARIPRVRVVHVTDGAPRDGRDARAHGFDGPASYAAARRREAEAALALASIRADQITALGIADQTATFELDRIARALAELMDAVGPRVILSHPYEGGHPDHDATAFAVQAAVSLSPAGRRAARAEFACYHAGAHGTFDTTFLEHPGTREITVVLDAQAQRVKTEMLGCHRTQAGVLACFPRDRERFRPAPSYDFSCAPHGGTLLYERQQSGTGWGQSAESWIDGVRWRAEAAAARRRLDRR